MTVAQQQALVLGLICLLTAVVLSAVLVMTRVSKFGTFAAANFFLGAAVFGAHAAFGFSGWRSEIVAASAVELPAVLLISWVCLAQAGGFGNRQYSVRSEPVVRRPRLRKALGWAPTTLLACWTFAVLVGLVWPSPAMQPYTSAPVQFVLFKWPISISQMIFAGLAAMVFAKSATSRTCAPVLRLRNGAFSVSMAALALVGGETALGAGVRWWIEGQRRTEIFGVLLAFETAVALVFVTSLVLGLTLRYTPVIAAAVLSKVHTRWLPAREQLESSGWQAMAGGQTRGIARVTYRVEEAAKLAQLPRVDAEKAVATIQLVAVMQNPSAEAGVVTAEATRELYDMEQEMLHDAVLAARIQASLRRRAETPGRRPLYAAPLQDALKAALDLTDKREELAEEWPLWFYLAAVASADAGLIDGDSLWGRLSNRAESTAAAEVYSTAKGKLRSRPFATS